MKKRAWGSLGFAMALLAIITLVLIYIIGILVIPRIDKVNFRQWFYDKDTLYIVSGDSSDSSVLNAIENLESQWSKNSSDGEVWYRKGWSLWTLRFDRNILIKYKDRPNITYFVKYRIWD